MKRSEAILAAIGVRSSGTEGRCHLSAAGRMNLVADEGIDKAIVDLLRTAGFSVRYFAEFGSGATDQAVLAAANDAQSLLLTSDKDFGELIFRQQLSS
jgi:hypothetical protein